MAHTFILHNQWALGDTVCLSALVRDIQLAHPGQYQLLMSGNYKSIWRNNPHCDVAANNPRGQLIKPEYLDGIKEAGRGSKKHFLNWFHEDFRRKTGIEVPVTLPKGDLHLSQTEKDKIFFPGRHWLVVAGGKEDMTAKVWSPQRFQGVVDALARQGVRCVQAGHAFNRHFHPQLHNCESALGMTKDVRDLLSLIYHCEGVICGITGFMHIAAAFDKPCVVIAGGREEPFWEAYTNSAYPESFGPACAPVKVEHRFLHTVGLLDCGIGNLTKGCWRSRTVPIHASDLNTQKGRDGLCKKPNKDSAHPMPECLHMISVAHVVEAVMSFYERGELPPIGKPSGRYTLPLTTVPAPALIASPRAMAAPMEVTLTQAAEDPAYTALDHIFIGGKFTVCVLCHGDHLALAKRCVTSIFDNSPAHRLDVRVALNQPSPAMLDYFNGINGTLISKIYLDTGERRKYPAMREMFWDETHPITTPYVLWFDDDSHVVDKTWLLQLAEVIIKHHPSGGRLYGTKFIHDLMMYKRKGFSPEKWFRAASWWQDRWMHTVKGTQTAPNGAEIVFASGGFWALATEAIRKGDIPDVRLNHNGGDALTGLQVHQAGFKVVDFCRGKKPVRWSDAPRRGFAEPFPWASQT